MEVSVECSLSSEDLNTLNDLVTYEDICLHIISDYNTSQTRISILMCGKTLWSSARRLLGCNKGVYGLVREFTLQE